MALKPLQQIYSFSCRKLDTSSLFGSVGRSRRNIENNFKSTTTVWLLNINTELHIHRLTHLSDGGDELEALSSVLLDDALPLVVEHDPNTNGPLIDDWSKAPLSFRLVVLQESVDGRFHFSLK